MKKIKLFYLDYCPHCKKSINDMKNLIEENEEFKNLEIEMIEESKKPDIANAYDYYFVPTFYVNDVKLCEGRLSKEDVEKVLLEATK